MELGDIGRTLVCAEICKGLDVCVRNEFISASFSEPKLLAWHSATTASVLQVLSFLLQNNCFLFGGLSMKKHELPQAG